MHDVQVVRGRPATSDSGLDASVMALALENPVPTPGETVGETQILLPRYYQNRRRKQSWR
jgi:hypothetical protein